MIWSVIVGWVLVVLGALCILTGIVVGVATALSKIIEGRVRKLMARAELTGEEIKAFVVIGEVLREIEKGPGGGFLVVGLILLGGGVALLMYQPF